MNWLNISIPLLRSPEYIGSAPTERATWISLQGYCADQENGGRIVGARSWNDRKWQQVAGVTHEEAHAATPLLIWDADDLVLWQYPISQEHVAAAKRLGGRQTAALRWGATPPQTPPKGKKGNSNSNSKCKDELLAQQFAQQETLTESATSSATSSAINSLYEWPTVQEWAAAAEVAGLPAHVWQGEWDNQERKPPAERWAKVDRSRLANHAAFIRRMWQQRGSPGPNGRETNQPTPKTDHSKGF